MIINDILTTCISAFAESDQQLSVDVHSHILIAMSINSRSTRRYH